MRLVGRPLEVYQYLEPLYNDYRKVCVTPDVHAMAEHQKQHTKQQQQHLFSRPDVTTGCAPALRLRV